MELLATNQPWNLILFMAIPVILAEAVAITELYLLVTKRTEGPWKAVNRHAGIVGGLYFIGVFFYLLMTAALPITSAGEWRGVADVIAVGAYLLGVVPLAGIALLELGIIARTRDTHGKTVLHAQLVGVFLVVAHVAMIFGMLDPQMLGWTADNSMTSMEGMVH